MAPPTPRLRASSDPLNVDDFEALPPTAFFLEQRKLGVVLRMRVRHQQLKADTQGMDTTQFHTYLQAMQQTCAQCDMECAPDGYRGHAANGKQQCVVDWALAVASARPRL